MKFWILSALIMFSVIGYVGREQVLAKSNTNFPIIRMAIQFDVETHPVGISIKKVCDVAFRRMGYRIEYRVLPTEKTTLSVLKRKSCGELARIKEYSEKYPELHMVPEPVYYGYGLIGYTTRKDIHIDGPDSLRKLRGLKVAFRRGSLQSEIVVEEYLLNRRRRNRVIAVSGDAGVDMVSQGKVDLYIDVKVDSLLKKYPNVIHAGRIKRFLAYVYFGPDRKHLVKELLPILKQMRKENLIPGAPPLLRYIKGDIPKYYDERY